MKVLLVNVTGRLSTDGSRLVSALLKRSGHSVRSIFLSRTEPLEYDRSEFALLDELLRDVGLVMISVYSSYAIRAAQLTDYVHARFPGLKVIWGGPHCISVPEIGLRSADGVCFSEGDEAVIDLVDRLEKDADWTATPNFAFRVNGSLVTNPVRPPFNDLDSLPYYDFDLAEQYLLDGTLEALTPDALKARLAGYPYRIPIFYYMSSRGCPHDCAYCNNCRYTALWGRSALRMQGVERVIEELAWQLKRLPYIEWVAFGDDDFFIRPLSQIEQFAALYKEKIGLPFGVAVSARTWRRDKAEVLLDIGLNTVQMGVQSGSQRVLDEVYNRKLSIAKVRAAGKEIAAYSRSRGLRLHLDFIIDNPYESRDDVARTYRYILDTAWNVKLNVFFLAYFPGTPLYERALADGYIRPYSQRAFRPYTRSRLRYQRNWETFLILLVRFLRLAVKRRKRSLLASLEVLGSRPVRLTMSLLPGAFFSGLARSLQAVQSALISRKVSVLR
jgi:anaerobic magnesium-protoporphyrin IX monomethyl ester cyclase